MQITMKQAELEVAVQDYVRKMGIARPVGEITFSATRGGDGVITEVEVGEMPSTASATPIARATVGDAIAEPAEAMSEVAEEEEEALDADDATTGETKKSLFG